MKKYFISIALLSGFLFAAQALPIVDVAPLDSSINPCTAQQEQFTKIKVVEIPKAVADTVKAKYKGCVIKEAAVDKSTMVYKVTVTTVDGKDVVGLYKATGEAIPDPKVDNFKEPFDSISF